MLAESWNANRWSICLFIITDGGDQCIVNRRQIRNEHCATNTVEALKTLKKGLHDEAGDHLSANLRLLPLSVLFIDWHSIGDDRIPSVKLTGFRVSIFTKNGTPEKYFNDFSDSLLFPHHSRYVSIS